MHLPSTYEETLALLDSLGMFHMDLGLGRMESALARLDLAMPEAVVQVVGTNGKGSTACFLAALATAHGKRTGLFTSPHLVDVRERVRLDGAIVSPGLWTEGVRAVWGACADLGLTYFELTTVVALWCFARRAVQVAVLEAGLGGTHDATCAVPPSLVLMTPVGMDHQNVLGPTLAHIARDKAGALGRCPSLTVPQDPEVLAIFQEHTEATPWPVGEIGAFAGGYQTPEGTAIDASWLPGQPPFQVTNAALALAGWERLARMMGWPVHRDVCREVVATVRWPGRFHEDGAVVVDGAHNPMGMAALDHALGDRRFAWGLFQSMQDKVLDMEVLGRLCRRCRRVLVPELPGIGRAWPAASLAARLGAEAVPSVAHALGRVGSDSALVWGSLYLVGAYFAARQSFPKEE
jgi:dihydrofolate synthase/folylpolyglutamate synthase